MNTSPLDYQYKIALRLKLRQTSGDAFQDFFSTVMGKLHGDDFVRVRPFGKKGDMGCYGHLRSSVTCHWIHCGCRGFSGVAMQFSSCVNGKSCVE